MCHTIITLLPRNAGPVEQTFKDRKAEMPNWGCRVAAAQCKKICPERLNLPGRLAGISEGHRGISK